MRDVTEAHFLHQRSGLEAVLRPLVPYPTCLQWVPGREELVVATRDGAIHTVDPVLGTRVVQQNLGEPAAMGLHTDRKRWLLVNRDGEWMIGRFGAGGGIEARGRHPFVANVEAFWLGEFAVMAGDEPTGRTLLLVSGGEEKARMWIPPRSVPIAGEDGKLVIARSGPQGLDMVKAARGMKFPEGDSTAHKLKTCGKYVLGFTPTGVAIWDRTGGQPRSMRLPDLTSGDINPAGTWLGLGTRTGAVALAGLGKTDGRAKPHLVKAFDQQVTCASFSDRGQWLATGAEGLQIWTWEEAT
jgi:hypothetical protein